jgi:hypothetical protein
MASLQYDLLTPPSLVFPILRGLLDSHLHSQFLLSLLLGVGAVASQITESGCRQLPAWLSARETSSQPVCHPDLIVDLAPTFTL